MRAGCCPPVGKLDARHFVLLVFASRVDIMKFVGRIGRLLGAGKAEGEAGLPDTESSLQDADRCRTDLKLPYHRNSWTGSIRDVFQGKASSDMKQTLPGLQAASEAGAATHRIELESVLEAVSDACLLIAEDGCIRFANRAAGTMFGYAPEELLARNIDVLVPPPVCVRHRGYMAGFMKNPHQGPMSRKEDLFALRRDMTEFPVDVSLSPLLLNGEEMILVRVSDIARRKRVETAFRDLGLLSAAVISAAQEGLIVYGRDLRYQVWNPFMEQLTGLSSQDVIGRHPLEVFPFLEEAGVIQRLEAALAGEIPAAVEFPFEVKQTGRCGWAMDRTAPLRNGNGEIIGAIATVADISETRLRQEEMRLAKEFFESTFSDAAAGMAIADPQGRYIRVNPAMIRFLGYTEEELLARTYLDITHPDDVHMNLEARTRMLVDETSTVRMEKRYIHKDGRAIWALLVASTVRDSEGKPLYTIGQMVDIDQQKRAEQALRLSEERFRSIFESTNTGIAATDASGRLVAFNNAFRELVGYAPDALLQLNFVDLTHPDDIADELVLFNELLSRQRENYRIEKRYRRQDGSVVNIDISVAPIRDEQDQVEYLIGVVNDITQRKKAEMSLIDSRKQLRELAAHQENLLEGERKRIASEIHDELGSLLTALKMDISLLRLTFGRVPALREKADEMRVLADRTIEVVRQVASNLRPAALDLGLVAAIEWLAEDFTLRYDLPCRLEVGGEQAGLDEAMATPIFRVVQESLTNIARHAGASEVSIGLRDSGDSLHLWVKDDGRGFDATAAQAGSGFGLFGMRERILALGGWIEIASAPGIGTTVAIQVPLARKEMT